MGELPWPMAPLTAVATEGGFIGGPFGSSLGRRDYAEVGVPVVRGKNLVNTYAAFADAVYVSEEKADSLARCVAFPGDIAVTQRGTLGQVAMLTDDFDRYLISQSQMALRVDRSIADVRYVLLAMRAEDFRRQITDRAIVTGVPHLNLGIFRELEIPFPPLRTQQAVAGVLGPLDAKIDSNRRLADELHECNLTAFVGTIRASDTEPTRLGDHVEVVMGQSPPGSSYSDDPTSGLPLVQGKGMFGVRHPRSELFTSSPTKVVGPGIALMTVRAPVGEVNVTDDETVLGRGVAALVGVHPSFTEYLVRSLHSRWASEESGTIFPSVNAAQIKNLEIQLPDEESIAGFEDAARPRVELLNALLREARTLTTIRDALLPKLVSGQIRVPLDDLEDVAAAAVDSSSRGTAVPPRN